MSILWIRNPRVRDINCLPRNHQDPVSKPSAQGKLNKKLGMGDREPGSPCYNPSIQEAGEAGMLQVSEPAWSTQRSRLACGYLARSCLRKEEEEEEEGPVVHTWEAEAGLLEPRSSGPPGQHN